MLYAKHLLGFASADHDAERPHSGIPPQDMFSVPTSPKIHELRARFEIRRHGHPRDPEQDDRGG